MLLDIRTCCVGNYINVQGIEGLVLFGFFAGFLFGSLRVYLVWFLGCRFWLSCGLGLLVSFLLRLGGS